MKRYFVLFFTFITLFSAKSNNENVQNYQAKPEVGMIHIIWDIARGKCCKDGIVWDAGCNCWRETRKCCMCGFGLCNPHIVDPTGERADQLKVALLPDNKMKIYFSPNIDNLRGNETVFSVEDDLVFESDVLNLFNLPYLKVNSGNYEYNSNERSVIVDISLNP